MNKNIDIHADDYGYTLNTSKDILECMKKGSLDSISIICNTSYFDESAKLLYKEIPSLPFLPLMSVHLNLVEGFNMSNTTAISRNGINIVSWGDMFIASLGGLKKILKEHTKKEIKAQIEKTNEFIEKCIEIAIENNVPCFQKGLRIDSHTHTHSIPLVCDALIEVLNEEKYNIEYIRNPREPIAPFIKSISLWKTFRPVNFIKNIILNVFAKKIDKYCKEHQLEKNNMWGLVMSGKMDIDRIKKIYPFMIKSTKNRKLEILFHPGLALEDEIKDELNKNNMRDFNMSNNRCIEKEAVLCIKEFISEE